MAFQLTEDHIRQHDRDGYAVFRRIVPASLIADMRREVEKALPGVREQRGPQGQRFGVSADLGIDTRPFEAFTQLPDLVQAIHSLLGESYTLTLSCILVNPAIRPYCTKWHRDTQGMTAHDNFTGTLADAFAQRIQLPGSMNQFNCPLYTDHATWFVPGSQARMEDTPGELDAANAHDTLFPPGIEERITDVELERLDADYCAAMPNAVQLMLEPGDFAIYRPHGWHIGNYVHYTRRATLHGWPSSPAEDQWKRDFNQQLKGAPSSV